MKHYDFRRETLQDCPALLEGRPEPEIGHVPARKEEDRHWDVYMRIVEYLKKIEWDKNTTVHKMNPFQYMTPACFWFWVCAEYFSFNLGCKKPTC